MRWRERDGLRWLEAELPGARAAFTTRLGGVSEGDFSSLNLALLGDDEPAATAENRRRLAAALDLDAAAIACAVQVHGVDLAAQAGEAAAFSVADWEEDPTAVPEADGHVLPAGARGVAALVLVADCLPVALAGPGGTALLHCGWRGLAGGILARGAAAVEATAAAIGPGIGPCCYEVGPEVEAAFAELGGDVLVDGDGAERPRLDLAEAARRLLARAGLKEVDSASLCTSCRPDLLFSHRRDAGRTGRQAAVAWSEG